jgi:hypothetical protein
MVQNPFNGIEREALDLLELIEKIKRRRRIHSMELKEATWPPSIEYCL